MNAAQALEIGTALSDLEKHIESRFPAGKPTSTYLSVTGEEYVAFATDIVTEGMTRKLYPTALEAIAAAKHSFNEYAEGRSGALYWRSKPEVDQFLELIPRPDTLWCCYMRLLISDKPAKED